MANSNLEIARSWRENVSLEVTWTPAPSNVFMPVGRCDGRTFTFDGFGRNAYLKPLRNRADLRLSAAKEKIASDLAHDLGVPVPPVVLATRVEGFKPSVQRSASLVMRNKQAQWRIASTLGGVGPSLIEAVPNLASVASRLFVFNAWVGQRDHVDGDPQGNLILGYGVGEHGDYVDVEIFALDYEGAFPIGTEAGRVARIPPSFPGELANRLSRSTLETAISDVEMYPDHSLSALVNRLPVDYLYEDEAMQTLDCLRCRRDSLRAAFATLLASTDQ